MIMGGLRIAQAWLLLSLSFTIGQALPEIDCYGANVAISLRSPNDHNSYVYAYSSALGIPINSTATPDLDLVLAQPIDACGSVRAAPRPGGVGLVIRGNCTFEDKLTALQEAGGFSGMILYSNDTDDCVVMSGNPNITEIVPLFAVAITHTAGLKLQDLVVSQQGGITVSLQQPSRGVFDPAEALIWLMAVGTVCGGGLWAGADVTRSVQGSSQRRGSRHQDTEDQGADITTHAAIGFVFVSSAMLLILYLFLSKWLTLFLICMFSIIAWQSTGDVLASLLSTVGFQSWSTRTATFPFLGTHTHLNLAAFSISSVVTATWFFCRHLHWSWILQDTLSICVMLLLLRIVRIPNLKVATILLSLALMYDVWWVYLQPLVTHSASVMVEVATAGGPTERLPMLLAVPLAWGLGTNPGLTVLGLGDMVLPGLLIAFTRRWDVVSGSSYFSPMVVGYGSGLVVTFIALVLGIGGQNGQPALLWLVPCTLGVLWVLAWMKKDVLAMWNGRPGPQGTAAASRGDYAAVPAAEPSDIRSDDVEQGMQ